MARKCLICGTDMTRSRAGYACPVCGRTMRFEGASGWIAYQPDRKHIAETIASMEACGIPAIIKANAGHGRVSIKEGGRVFGYMPGRARTRRSPQRASFPRQERAQTDNPYQTTNSDRATTHRV